MRVSYAARDAAATGLRESPEKRRIRRANALWEENMLARACAATLPSLDPVSSDDVLLKLRNLFPARPVGDHMPGPDPAQRLANDVRARILAAVPKVIRTLPRRSGSGPTSSRFDHWMILRNSAEGLELAAELLVRLMCARGHCRGPLLGTDCGPSETKCPGGCPSARDRKCPATRCLDGCLPSVQ